MSEAEIQSIMQYGGYAALLIFLLITAIVVLWRQYQAQVKTWTETQIEDTKSVIEVTERSTNAIVNLTELLKASSAANAAYQAEMRSKVEAAVKEFQTFRLEMLQRRRN